MVDSVVDSVVDSEDRFRSRVVIEVHCKKKERKKRGVEATMAESL